MILDKVLITGSSNGLGKHLALYFLEKGHEVILHGRNKKQLEAISSSVKLKNRSIKYYVCDLLEEESVKKLAEFAKTENVKILINNAGIHCKNKPFLDLDIEYMNNIININLKAPIILTYYLLNSLNNIININSMSGIESKKYRTLYAASKWGLKGFSESLKNEIDKKNILDVYPTSIKTNDQIENGMEVDNVAEAIYEAYINKKKEVILDGRF